MARYFLTGATGFVGANVARALIARGDEAICAIRKPNLCIEGLPIRTAAVSLTDTAGLTEAMRGCDAVLHVAGSFDTGPDGERSMWALHVDATQALLDAAHAAGVRRFVTCSSSITVGFGTEERPGDEESPLDPDAAYGRTGALRAYYDSKLESERITFERGGIVVNPDFVLGAWDVKPTSGQLLVAVSRRWVPVFPTGGKCFVDAEDCALGHILAAERGQPGRRYLLGNWNLSYRRFMELCAAAAGRRGPVVAVPNLALKAAGVLGGVLGRVDSHRFAGLDPHVLAAMRVPRYRSGKRSWEELGVPRTPMEVTVKRALDWFRGHGYC